jgi:hypothetical protein
MSVSVWKMASASVQCIIRSNQTHEHEIEVLYCTWCSLRSQESSVYIMTQLQARQLGSHSIASRGKISSRVSRLATEPTQPPIYCVQSVVSLAIQQMAWIEYLSPATVEFKNEWSCISTHQNAWVACTWLVTSFHVAYCQRKVTIFGYCWQLESLYSCDIQMCDTTEILSALIRQPLQRLTGNGYIILSKTVLHRLPV